jgi:hypothetical protein
VVSGVEGALHRWRKTWSLASLCLSFFAYTIRNKNGVLPTA